MAKRNKKQEEKKSYEPFEGYSKTIKPQTMTNKEYLEWRQKELPYTKRQGKSLIKGRNVLNDYMKKQKEKYDAGRKVIESTITMPIAQKKFQRREMGADPLGKKWDLAKDGKTQLTMPALTEDEKKTVNRYNASKKTGNQVWDKNGQPLDKVSVSKGKAAEAYLQDIAQRKAQQQAQKAAEGNSYPTFRKWRKANNQTQTGNKAITIGDYNSYINGLLKDRDTGIYDQGTDPYMMSDAGIAQNITRNDTKAKEAAGKAEELVTAYNKPWNPEQNWAGIFDLLEDWDEAEDDAIMRGKYTNEEKLEAQKRYSAKRNSRDSLKQEVTDKAEAYFDSFARDQWINDWENASDDEKEQLRGIMYDKIMPDQYADRVARMTPEQKEQFNAEFDKMLDTAIGEGSRDWFDYEDDYNTYMAQKNANEKQAAKLREEQKRRKSIETLTGWAKDSTQSADYNPDLVKVKQFSPDEWRGDYYYEPEGTETDKAYFYANNVPADLATIDPNNMNKYYFIASDPKILNTFTKLYNQDHATPGKVSNMADQFLQALDPYLNYCLSHYQDNWIREIAEDPVKGPIMRAAAIPLNAVGSMVGLAGVPMAAMGLDSAQDPNSGWYITSKMVTTTRQHQNEKAGEALGDLVSGWFDEEYRDQVRQAVKDGTVFGLNVVDSITDNFFAKGIGTLIAGTDKTEEAYKKTKNVIQWIMSGEAASNTMIQKLQENKDPTEAAIYAIADGVIEWVTEEKSIESWLGHDYRAMLGDKAALRRTIRNAMIAEGSEEINADALNLGVDILMSVIYGHENELTERYNNLIANDVKPDEAFRRVLMDKLGQMGVSGLAGAASGGLMAGGMYMGTAINNRQTGSNINSNENTYEGETGTNRTVELGLQMDNDTMAHDIAMRLQQQIDNGEKPSDYDIGKLAQAIQIEASETLRKADSGENVSEEELNKSLDTLKSMAEIREGRKAPADLSGVGLQYAAEEDIRQAEGERITDGNEVIHDGRFTKLLGVESDGKNGMRFRIQTENGTQTVDSDAILATDAATASIIRQATVYQKGLYSAEYVNKLLENKNSAETMTLLRDATRLRLSGYLGQQMPETTIDRKLAIELYNMSALEHAANRKTQVGQSNRQQQGRVTYKGFEYGTTEWNNALKEIKNKNIRAEMDAIAGIAQRAGIEVTFMDLADTEQALQGMGEKGDASKYYGWENRSGISVNMEGLNYGTLDGKVNGRHNMVVTFGHEMTHWLQRNSLQGYNRLEQFVMNDLIKNVGMSRLTARLDMYMRSGETLEGAMSEVVANSCDQILGNEQVMEHIQNTDKSLYQEVKNFVRDLVSRVKNAIRGMSESASYEGRAMIRSTNEMAKVWLGAYDEALTQATNETKPVEQMTPAELEGRYSREYKEYEFNPEFEDAINLYYQNSIDNDFTDFKNKFGDREIVIGETFQILQDMGIKNRPLVINQDHIGNSVGVNADPVHKVTPSELMDIIRKANNPVTIIRSRSQNRQNDSVVIIVDHKIHDDIVMVPIRISTEAKVNTLAIDANKMASAYGNDKIDNQLEEAEKVELEGKIPGIYYISEEKTDFLKNEGVQFPSTIKKTGLLHKITDNPYFVNQDDIYPEETKELMEKMKSSQAQTEKNTEDVDGIPDAIDTGKTGNRNTSVIDSIAETVADVNDDAAYQAAVERGDLETASRMLMEKLKSVDGVIPFMAPEWHAGESQKIAENLKDNDPEAIRKAAEAMAKLVPDNAVLIPMPGRNGIVEEGSWIMNLTNRIAELSGRPVVVALEGQQRESRQEAKHDNRKGVSQEELGFRVVEEIPEGTLPIFIDNTVGTGITADAARIAMGGGMTLAYTKTLRSPGIVGLKNVLVTYESKKNGGALIPLSQRFDVSKRDVRYSQAQLDSEYMTAVESGDMDTAARLVEEEAERAGYDTPKLFHGTRGFGFTEFDLGQGGGLIFATTDRRIAETYSGETERSRISDRATKDANNLHGTRLLSEARKYFKKYNDYKYMKQSEREEMAQEYKENIARIRQEIEEYISDNDGAFNEQKLRIVNRIPSAIRELEIANSWNEVIQAWNHFESSVWAMKWEDESRLEDMIGRGTNRRLNNTYDVLKDMYYDGDIYINKYDRQRAYDSLIAMEVNAKLNQGVYELYGRTDNQLVIDAKGANWNQIIAPEELNLYGPQRTRDIAAAAKENGYDSVLLKNVKDSGGETPYNMPSDVYIFFNENAVKSADPVTYDDQGNVIPPSERFNSEKTDIRWSRAVTEDEARMSRWTEEGLDVNTWMMNATPSTFQTEDEQALWQAYKDLRIKMSLSLHRQNEYQAKIRQLESKTNLTAEERDELTANRNRLEIQQKKMADLEDELYQVTSSEGYAGMMYRQNMVLKDYIQGKTQDQVRQTVEGMLKEVQRAQEEIKKDRADLMKLAETQAVKTVESYMSKSSLGKMAGMLRSNYNSAMGKGEIQSRLAEMALKQAQGEDITSDAEQLAQDLLDKMRGIQTDALQQLKGTTLKISEELAKEMRAENLTMADLRAQLKGSGVKIVTEKGANIRQQWAEMYDQNQSLPNIDEDYSESGALHHILDFIQGEVDASRGMNQNEVNFDEVAAVVKIAAGNITTYLVDDPAARRQIENLMGQVKELAGKTGDIAQKMEELDRRMDEVVLAGQKAKGWTTILQRDVNEAIKYYNKTARVAAQVEKTKVRKALIEQLRSENTKKLIAQEEEFRERLKKDKTARALAQDNLIIRRKIHTVTKRMATLLAKETDQKNIPEKAKPLARQMLRMIANHDLNYRMVTFGGRDGLDNLVKTLDILDARDGKFTDDDLNWLIVGEGENADWDIHDAVVKALIDIETGLMEYRNAEGRANTSLMDRKNALTKVQQAVSKIYGVIRASQMAEINGRQMMVDELAIEMLNDMAGKRYKEFQGWFGRKKASLNSWAVYGNMTPEYFIRNLKNGTLSYIYDEYHRAENRAGLEYGKAQETLELIAAETGYGTWDQKKKYTIKLEKGGTVELNIEQLMQLYATWKREETLQAEVGSLEKTFHLTKGGFYVKQEEKHKLYGREELNERAYRMTETDFAQVVNALTAEQKEYADRVVKYLSQDMSELGNEASMRMYGIKKYNEKYYFPFEIWNGVKAVKSDAGAGGNMESHRGAHPSFSNRLRNNASNALMIRGFTETAAKHIVQMINYNTFAPAIENLQRVMNTQVITGEEDNITNRNLWAAFGESYGKEALKYLQDFQLAVNGGVSRQDSSLYDKLLSTFRKSAVAGSLSVAAQQPLSYIRAAMEIDPKYLIAAWNPAALAKTKEIVREMRENSGVAMLKKMGKFDMGIGRSAQQFITPDAKQGAVRTAYNWTSDKLSALPELMDTVTWARIWTAVKMEQQAQNKGMDFQSKEFMEKVTNRFNEVLRLTQVYDSVLVRSANMRSTNKFNKMVTSFMAEPTLTANVLADALVNVKEKGGKTRLAKAAATFIMSAVAQAFVKGMMGAGRNPDKKKTWDENAAYRFMYNFISEINPLNLIPGYNDLITLLKTGEVSDDALGVVGKVMAAGRKGYDLISGKETDYYRGIEDSFGVIAQIFTNIPAKNIARDARAMYNFFTQPYAQRPNSQGVLTYQLLDQVFTADSLLGALNELTGEKIYGTKNADYYARIYNAERDGDTETAKQMREHLLLGKGLKADTLDKGIKDVIKANPDATDSEKIKALREYGMKDSDIAEWIVSRFKKGELTKEEAKRLYHEADPKKTADEAYYKIEQAEWEGQTGENVTDSEWFRINEALDSGNEKDYNSAVSEMLAHGGDAKEITDHTTDYIMKKYKQGEMGRSEAERLLKKYNPELTDNDVWWKMDRVEYNRETGKDAGSGQYYRFRDAIENGKQDDMTQAVKLMTEHGMELKNIMNWIGNKSTGFKTAYLNAKGSEKDQLRLRLIKAYKAVGLTESEAIKMINSWKETK